MPRLLQHLGQAELMDSLGRGGGNSYTFKEAKEAFEANTKGVGKDGNAVIKIIIAGPVEADTA